MFDENILYERLNSLEKGVKRTDHDIKRLLNSNKNYSERLEWLKRMEVAFESLEPNTWEEWACKLYVECPDLHKVAKKLDEMGFRLESAIKSKTERKIKTEDISNLIKGDPKFEMQECAKRFFEQKNKVYWGEY